ncbi:MAG: hypothetical protein U5K28_02550 [Halobacteriales archaeon]|nr:hypothetical protein [Halobacteriales archaeon]
MLPQTLSKPYATILGQICATPAGCSADDLRIAAANNGIENPDPVVESLVDVGLVHQLGNGPRMRYVVSPTGRALL